jgi:hypothetical protein
MVHPSRSDKPLWGAHALKANVFVVLGIGFVVGFLVARTITVDNASCLLPELLQAPSLGTLNKVSSVAKSDKDMDIGWNSLHIYYGEQSPTHFEIIEPMSQVKQDEYVAAMLSKKSGFFVDLAANDATYLSNTFTLERDYQWNGSMFSRFVSRYKSCYVVELTLTSANTTVVF